MSDNRLCRNSSVPILWGGRRGGLTGVPQEGGGVG